MKTLFEVDKIPSDNHVRDVLDGVDAKELKLLYDKLHLELMKKENSNILSSYLHINKSLLIIIDGTRYYDSQRIHCNRCQRRIIATSTSIAKATITTTTTTVATVANKQIDINETTKNNTATNNERTANSDGNNTDNDSSEEATTIQYYHSAITPCLAHPRKNIVIPLFPEFITNKDGNKKQDCEITAAKRWLDSGTIFDSHYPITLLGDDLYSHVPFIKLVKDKKYNFIFVCKPSSHTTLASYTTMITNLGNMDTLQETKKVNSKKEHYYTYSFVNDIPLSDKKDSVVVVR